MPTISRTACVPYSAEEMYVLVLDVGSYPRFLPWCVGAETRSQNDAQQIATIKIARGPLKRSLTTRNRLQPNESIDIDLVDGPFRHLVGRWLFQPLDSGGCEVSLTMKFDLGGGLLQKAVGQVFNQIAGQMVNAFYRRAESIYGKRSDP